MSFEIQQLLRPAAPPCPGDGIAEAKRRRLRAGVCRPSGRQGPCRCRRRRPGPAGRRSGFRTFRSRAGQARSDLRERPLPGLCHLLQSAADRARPICRPGPSWRTGCSFAFLKTNRILPISFDGRRLLIATADPFVDECGKGHQLHARRARRSRRDRAGGNRTRLAHAVPGRGVRDARREEDDGLAIIRRRWQRIRCRAAARHRQRSAGHPAGQPDHLAGRSSVARPTCTSNPDATRSPSDTASTAFCSRSGWCPRRCAPR